MITYYNIMDVFVVLQEANDELETTLFDRSIENSLQVSKHLTPPPPPGCMVNMYHRHTIDHLLTLFPPYPTPHLHPPLFRHHTAAT